MPCLSRMLVTVPRAIRYPRFQSAPRIRPVPPVAIFFCLRMTKDSIWLAVRGRPGPRFAVPAYFLLDQLAVPGQQSAGRDDGCQLRQGTPSRPLRLHRQAPALIIVEPKTPAPELLPEDRILVAQIFDCQLLLLVH